MPVIQTETLDPSQYSRGEIKQIYCGLDSCVTWEVRQELARLHPQLPAIYDFERALQAPYLEVMLRGWKVDELSRRQACEQLHVRKTNLELILNQLANAVWDRDLNPRSSTQLKEFFYRRMRIPEVWISQKGVRRVSANREALEKIDAAYLHARPFVSCILAVRDLAKQLEVLETAIDSDGRYRTSYNIAGTETGRPSSSANSLGTGGNTQNVAPSLRYVYIADPGWKICQIDLEQVEARDVGWFCGVLFGDWKYLDTLEQTDLHTYVTRMVWPQLPWTGDLRVDKEMADSTLFYRDYSYRYTSKRGAHLSNYSGTAWTAARILKMPLEHMELFQARYCRGGRVAGREIEPIFPAIPRFWNWVAAQIQTKGFTINPFGRRRDFFGRSWDDATVREGIAGLPQGTTADRTNLGWWRIWRYMPEVQLLGQGFDSVTFQYRENDDAQAIIGRAQELMAVELNHQGRKYVVPSEAKVGWNWGNFVGQADVDRALARGKRPPRLNPEGLIKFDPQKPDLRVRRTGLQRMMT